MNSKKRKLDHEVTDDQRKILREILVIASYGSHDLNLKEIISDFMTKNIELEKHVDFSLDIFEIFKKIKQTTTSIDQKIVYYSILLLKFLKQSGMFIIYFILFF